MADKSQLIESYPFLGRGDAPLIDRVLESGAAHSLAAGTHVMFEGNRCVSLPLLLTGLVRVYKLDESGREITLYRIEPGESCVLTAACILGDIGFPANAMVERDAEVFVLPSAAFREMMAADGRMQQFIFELIGRRLAAVIEVVEEVAFRRVDERLVQRLLHGTAREREESSIELTHAALARELATSREVVSRLLKDLEVRGLVELGRGVVRILDRKGLKEILKS